MINTIFIIFGWLTLMSFFIVILPEEKYLRVFSFVKMALNRIPFTSVAKALKGTTKDDK